MRVAKVRLSFIEHGHLENMSFSIEYVNFEQLKQEFLKRFGNLRTTNKLTKQKPLIKKLTYKADTFEEWSKLIRLDTDYILEIKFTKGAILND